jgi:hypothetical protein
VVRERTTGTHVQQGVGAPVQEWNYGCRVFVMENTFWLGVLGTTTARAGCSVCTRIMHSLDRTCLGGMISAASALLHAATCVQAQGKCVPTEPTCFFIY